jgi:hypothetical protein
VVVFDSPASRYVPFLSGHFANANSAPGFGAGLEAFDRTGWGRAVCPMSDMAGAEIAEGIVSQDQLDEVRREEGK